MGTATGATGTSGATVGVTATGGVVWIVGAAGWVVDVANSDAWAAPMLVCQPMIATMPNSAVVESPVASTFAVSAGFDRFFDADGWRSAARRSADDAEISVIVAAVPTTVVIATMATAAVVVDGIARRRVVLRLDRRADDAELQVGVELHFDGPVLELHLDVGRVLVLRLGDRPTRRSAPR